MDPCCNWFFGCILITFHWSRYCKGNITSHASYLGNVQPFKYLFLFLNISPELSRGDYYAIFVSLFLPLSPLSYCYFSLHLHTHFPSSFCHFLIFSPLPLTIKLLYYFSASKCVYLTLQSSHFRAFKVLSKGTHWLPRH